jgi:sec-independent protein translocase protein TatB
MFDISWTEFVLIGIVALIVIGPKELPGVLRTLGQYTRKVRGMAAEFQNQFQEAMREAEMGDLKKQVDEMAHDFKNYDPLKDVRDDVEAMGKDIERSFDGSPVMKADAPAAELPAAPTPAIESAAPTTPVEQLAPLSSRAGCAHRRIRCRACRARQYRALRMSRERRRRKEIEATKAPLMDHLIELRSRLIKALAAFFLAAVVCFFFAKHIYNVLTWPYIWVAGAGEFQIHLYRPARIFRRAAQAFAVRRGLHRVPGGRDPNLHVRRAGALSQREAGVSCLI